MKRFLLTATFLTFSVPVFAAEIPKPCGPHVRERCIAYKPGQIVSLILAPGITTTIELPSTETVFYVGTSDDGIIRGNGEAPRVPAGSNSTEDPNLRVSVPGSVQAPSQFITLKALHHLEPQSFVVIGQWTNPLDGKTQYRRHIFELKTAPDVQSSDLSNPFYSLVFSDPVTERVVRRAKWEKEQAEIEASRAADRLKQVNISVLKHNLAYRGQGTDADRAALVPLAPPGLDAMWDDGHRTFLRFPGNRRVPMAYQIMPDGTEALVGQSTVADPATNGNLLVVQAVLPSLRLRDGDSILCITNNAYDPVGNNPGTGTADPGVVRMTQEAASDVR